MEAIDDDFFSDDGFEDLPADALQQLEHDAFRATQFDQPTQQPPQPEPEGRQDWDVGDVVDQTGPLNVANATLQPPAHLHTGITNDYGALDVGELDAEVFDNRPSHAVALDETMAFPDQPTHNVHDTIVVDDEDPMQTEGDPSFFTALQREHQSLSEKVGKFSCSSVLG